MEQLTDQINLALHPQAKWSLRHRCMHGFNRKIQDTTMMNYNFNGFELEEYSWLANNCQTMAPQMLSALGPEVPRTANAG